MLSLVFLSFLTYSRLLIVTFTVPCQLYLNLCLSLLDFLPPRPCCDLILIPSNIAKLPLFVRFLSQFQVTEEFTI